MNTEIHTKFTEYFKMKSKNDKMTSGNDVKQKEDSSEKSEDRTKLRGREAIFSESNGNYRFSEK